MIPNILTFALLFTLILLLKSIYETYQGYILFAKENVILNSIICSCLFGAIFFWSAFILQNFFELNVWIYVVIGIISTIITTIYCFYKIYKTQNYFSTLEESDNKQYENPYKMFMGKNGLIKTVYSLEPDENGLYNYIGTLDDSLDEIYIHSKEQMIVGEKFVIENFTNDKFIVSKIEF